MAGKKYWDVMYTLRPSTSVQMPNIELHRPGIEPGPPLIKCGCSTIELWNLYIIWVCLRPSTSLQMPNNELHPRESNLGPPDRMWTLYHWAMESVHNMGVLVSWPPGRGQILCNYSTPPPISKHSCIPTLWRGRGSPASQPPSPEYLLTQNSYKETSAPL